MLACYPSINKLYAANQQAKQGKMDIIALSYQKSPFTPPFLTLPSSSPSLLPCPYHPYYVPPHASRPLNPKRPFDV